MANAAGPVGAKDGHPGSCAGGNQGQECSAAEPAVLTTRWASPLFHCTTSMLVMWVAPVLFPREEIVFRIINLSACQ